MLYVYHQQETLLFKNKVSYLCYLYSIYLGVFIHLVQLEKIYQYSNQNIS